MAEDAREIVSVDHRIEPIAESKVEAHKTIIGGKTVILVDTPGFEPESDVFQEVANWKSKKK